MIDGTSSNDFTLDGMGRLRAAGAWVWWLAVAYVPVAQFEFARRYSAAIGCPSSGDCYVPGSEHLLYLDMLFIGAALLLWPACVWFLVLRPSLAGLANQMG